ncbi:MAG: hypothetical protein H8E37_06335 [Planctomycetes bacterium]|nr:hypothetical protein [Planctomycetota bacterium]
MRIRIPTLVSLLCLGLVFSLPGCGGDEDDAEGNGGAGADGENAAGNGGESQSGGETAGTGGGTTNGGGEAGGFSGGPSASAVPVGTNVAEGFNVDIMHYSDQGSGFFPMAVIRALKDSETNELFLENLERFGLVPGEVTEKNPEGFPVGIVTNTIKYGDHEVEMFGFTCAACHTSDISYKGKTIRIEGGSGLFYVDALGDAVANSLNATFKSPKELFGFLKRLEQQIIDKKSDEPSLLAKFKSFDHIKNDGEFGKGLAAHILGRVKKAKDAFVGGVEHVVLDAEAVKKVATDLLARAHSDESPLEAIEDELEHGHLSDDLHDLESALADIKYRARFLAVRNWLSKRGNRLAAGYGRADDFGTARVELFGHVDPFPGGNVKNMVPVNAPVSTPQLWNVDEYAWLHWNANTNSVIQRSIGESIGVGATFELDPAVTSVPIVHQMHIEQQILKVLPPQWPGKLFGEPDEKKVARGKELFAERCQECHTPAGRDEKDLLVFNLATLEEVGTDPADATNFDRPVYQADDSTAGFAQSISKLLTTLQLAQKKTMTAEEQALMDELEKQRWPVKWRDTMAVTGGPVYPAKPLEGTWATGPFLHNGSVPTLYHLLLPSDQRPKKFFVGSHEFDPQKVGFHYENDTTHNKYLKAFELDTSIPGNRNTGHEFGTDLSDEDRMALIEYLKVHKDDLSSIDNKVAAN